MIREAKEQDIPKIGALLSQVDLVHHNGRPDIFKVGRKYSDAEISAILQDKNQPILVATDEDDTVTGYCFCVYRTHPENSVLTDIKTLFIDDFCVDETLRGQGIGKELYKAAVALAKENGCYNVTLNVWSFNESAIKFYESCGLSPQKTVMEQIL